MAKIRSGHVSNSSSSSFIATVSQVIDEEKFKAFNEKHKLGLKVYTSVSELIGDLEYCGDFYDNLYLDRIRSLEEPIKVVFLTGCGPDGDGYFDPECTGDYNYDVDLDDFDEKDQIMYCASTNEGLKVITQTYYAGRDG